MARMTGLEPATSGVTGRRSNQLSYIPAFHANKKLVGWGFGMARMTGLEPATSGVTGRRSNQLSYIPITRTTLTAAEATCSVWSGAEIRRERG